MDWQKGKWGNETGGDVQRERERERERQTENLTGQTGLIR
jgi:hypothetical protein